MHWIMRVSGVVSLAMATIILSPSLQSFPQTEAIRSNLHPPLSPHSIPPLHFSPFKSSPLFHNSPHCHSISAVDSNPKHQNCIHQPELNNHNPKHQNCICQPELIHIAITLDSEYLRGSIAAVHSILHHSNCPENLFFHFLVITQHPLQILINSTFPHLNFKLYTFNPNLVKNLISTSVRAALEQPLNYARNYLSDLLPLCVKKIIYLDSDLVLVDDIEKLWGINLENKTIGAPEYCHANFSSYFTRNFWGKYRGTFEGRKVCYFNTGVMVMDMEKWREIGFTREIEKWMEVQKKERIYELGSLPPFLLVFAGNVAPIDHRWNQHGLGGDNVRGSCRDLHAGPVSLLHWSGSGKPWLRLDSKRPCPLDSLWSPYDLYGQ